MRDRCARPGQRDAGGRDIGHLRAQRAPRPRRSRASSVAADVRWTPRGSRRAPRRRRSASATAIAASFRVGAARLHGSPPAAGVALERVDERAPCRHAATPMPPTRSVRPAAAGAALPRLGRSARRTLPSRALGLDASAGTASASTASRCRRRGCRRAAAARSDRPSRAPKRRRKNDADRFVVGVATRAASSGSSASRARAGGGQQVVAPQAAPRQRDAEQRRAAAADGACARLSTNARARRPRSPEAATPSPSSSHSSSAAGFCASTNRARLRW